MTGSCLKKRKSLHHENSTRKMDTSRRKKKSRKTKRDMRKDNRGRSKENGKTWKEVENIAADRIKWRGLVSALGAIGREEER